MEQHVKKMAGLGGVCELQSIRKVDLEFKC